MPNAQRTRTVALLGFALALLLLSGCGTDRTATDSSPADPSARANETTLAVTIEGSSAPSPVAGMVRWSLVSLAHNSTNETMTLRSVHNYPQVFDSAGTPLIALDGASLVATKAGRGGDRLDPGGTVGVTQAFDVDPSVTELRVVWDLSPEGTFEQLVP